MERVHVSGVDTAITPYDQQTSSSRSTYCMGNAVLDALAGLEEQLGALAEAEPGLEGADPGGLVRSAGRGNLIAHGSFTTSGGLDPETGQGVASAHWHQTAAGAEVEVDLDTGAVEILHFYTATYAGRVVSRTLAELQCEGNVAFGVGQALFEEMEFDHGQLAGANLGDYHVVSFADMPGRLEVSLLEGDADAHVHGLGETALPAVCPAVGNAVSRAIGGRITELPFTPERVLGLVREREATAVAAGS
jgi:CO/xanthine dehydrogenase Mo-binding subunit